MNDIPDILTCLAKTPEMLQNLIAAIPQDALKTRRIPHKWSIHEHACHIVDVQPMLLERMKMCLSEPEPRVVPYFPDKGDAAAQLLQADLDALLTTFPTYRAELMS